MQYRLWLILAVLLDLSWNGIAILGKKLLVRTLLYRGPRKKTELHKPIKSKGLWATNQLLSSFIYFHWTQV